jgi:SPP1 gp7 family putative phage head morphogenesis protein
MAKTSNFAGAYFNQDVRHQVYLQRYNTHVVQRMIALLNRNDAALMARIQTLEFDSLTLPRLEKQLEEVRKLQEALAKQLQDEATKHIQDLAAYESRYVTENINATFGVRWDGPTIDQVRAAAMSRPFQSVHLKFANLAEQLDEFGKRRGDLIRGSIRQGFLQGTSVDDLVRQLRGTKAQKYRDGLFEGSRRTTETIVRTALNHTANSAREEVYKANAHQMDGVQIIAVLDQRTTSICQNYNNQVFKVDEGPRPPFHPNCRTTTIPVFKGEEPIKHPSYSEWLKSQDAATQKSVLGVNGYAAYQGGKTPTSFADTTNAAYTLDKLTSLDNQGN